VSREAVGGFRFSAERVKVPNFLHAFQLCNGTRPCEKENQLLLDVARKKCVTSFFGCEPYAFEDGKEWRRVFRGGMGDSHRGQHSP